ncbi:MAG: aldehyde dehydrogenase family protein [Chloroflexaceae bacterium]|nr:aldehyde dehydrogenase family protein [Chloroflexaceae bacterium]
MAQIDVSQTPSYALLLAGAWQHREPAYEVRSPYSNAVIARVSRANAADVESAIAAAVAAFEQTRQLPAYLRAQVLRDISAAVAARAEELAVTIAQEAAKPIKHARAEVQRCVFTFAWAAEETGRIAAELLPMDVLAAGVGRQGLVKRFPIGPVAAITPFNFPLNLVAHKLAPAIAAGCPVVLKPASQTPISSLKLAEIILATDWPAAGLSVLSLASSDAALLVRDERIKALTFTGSPAVGWALKSQAGRKRVMLELGGNAGVIIHHDAPIEQAVARVVAGGFAFAGQSCISVQRVFVHESIYEAFLEQLIPAVERLHVGDPLDEASDLSALITPADCERVAAWLAEARAAGAQIRTGGVVDERTVRPTVITDAHADLKVNCQELFAPVITVQPYTHEREALDAVNQGDFGLQAGLFTNDLRFIWQAYETLEVGGLIVNDVPTWRADHMPYGGVKQSGFGREGLRYAIEELTEPRLLVLGVG